MHPYLLLVAAACGVSAFCAGGLYARSPGHPASRLAALLLAGASYWAGCEVFWNSAPDAETAAALVRAAAPGWIFVGPVVLHTFLSASSSSAPRLRRLLVPLYAASCGFLLLAWFTPWMIASAVRTSWGWGYRVGPVYPLFAATTMLGSIAALHVVRDLLSGMDSVAERRLRPWLTLSVAVPFCIGPATDLLLPIFDVQVPRFGTASFTALGLIAFTSLRYFGLSFLTLDHFADEILATLPDGVTLLHNDDRIRCANEGLARLSGHPVERLEGMPIGELLSFGFSGVPAETDEVDCELTGAAGERIPVGISSAVLRDRQDYAIGLVLVVRDLREVADLRNRLVTSARLAAVGELAAGIAHEINNPIAFVLSNLGQLQGHWKTVRAELDPQHREDAVADVLTEGEELIAESIEGVERAAEIVRGVKGFSHAGSGGRELADLNELLEDVLHMAAAQLRDRVNVERRYVDLPPVPCAPQQIKQVFLNLILNAGQALPDGGTIRIVTERGEGSVAVRVEDDGTGIAPEIIGRIFDPFFTTKRAGEGTGLGLGIAYQIVRNHGGEMRVASQPGRGTCFRVRLPAAR
jgi:signal transduction histidine kinase